VGKRGRRRKKAARWKEEERLQKKKAREDNNHFLGARPRARLSFFPTKPTSPATTMDKAAPWACESPAFLTVAVLVATVVFLLVLFWGTPMAHGGGNVAIGRRAFTVLRDDTTGSLSCTVAQSKSVRAKLYGQTTGNAVPDRSLAYFPSYEGTVDPSGRRMAHVVDGGKSAVTIRGTDIIYEDTKGEEPYPRVSLLEFHAKGQARVRELSVRIDTINGEVRSIYILLVGVFAILVVWFSRVGDAITDLKYGKGGKSCTPSQLTS